MSTILPYGNGPGEWNNIRKLLQTAANYNFASGQKMTIKGTVCGNVANASSVQGNGNYTKTGTVDGTEWVGATGPIHSTYNSQPFACQWWTTLPPACPNPPNEPSNQLFVDIATASNTAKALTPTQTFAGIDTSGGDVTINVVSGLNVINVPPNPYGTTEGKLQVRGGNDLTISGPADAVVIFNVGADNEVNAVRNGMSIENGSSILITGGVQAQNILFNVIGGDVPINAGDVYGNILVRAGSDVKGKATIQGSSFIHGIVIGDGVHSSEFLLDTDAQICGSFVYIEVTKDVSPDGGFTWYPADDPPGPDVLSTINPHFRFTVTNTGTVTLTNVQVTDDVYGPIGTVASLAPGASSQFIYDGTWLLGQQVNTATATGDYDSETVSDTNPAYWVGVEAPTPAIDVEKEVSNDNGTTWFDADTPTGPNVVNGTNPQFRFTVTNTGNVTLTNVVVTDNVYGVVIGPIPSLAPGASASNIVVGIWALGQHVNTAVASSDEGADDEDFAYWFGVEEPTADIDVEKEVSPDNGVTWFDADSPPGSFVPQGTNPQFRFTVRNTGNLALTNVRVNDNVFGLVIVIPSMAPGASASTTVVGIWALGQQSNTATATCNEGVSDVDPAYWFGEEAPTPEIDVGKEVSNDNGVTWQDADVPTGPFVPNGTNPRFRFTVTNTGLVPLTNVQVTDNVYGLIGTIANLAHDAFSSWIIIGTWASGQQVNTVTATCNEGVSATDPAYWFGVSPAIAIEKYVSVDNGATWLEADTPPGPLLPAGITPQFKIVVTNTGDVTLTNIQVTDTVFGNVGTLASMAPGASNEWILS